MIENIDRISKAISWINNPHPDQFVEWQDNGPDSRSGHIHMSEIPKVSDMVWILAQLLLNDARMKVGSGVVIEVRLDDELTDGSIFIRWHTSYYVRQRGAHTIPAPLPPREGQNFWYCGRMVT